MLIKTDLPLLYFPRKTVAAGISITFTDTKTDDNGGVNNPVTFNGGGNPSIGASDSQRVIVIEVMWRVDAATGLTGVTVNGNAATQISGAAAIMTNGVSTDMWQITEAAAGTSGLTTAAVVVTFNETPLRAAIGVHRVLTSTPTPSTAANNQTASAQTLALGAITVPASGGSIACSLYRNAGTATWTGLSNDYDSGIVGIHDYTGTHSSAAGSVTYTVTFTGSANQLSMSAAAWGP